MTIKYTVFIGRFQPFHIGHLSVVERAMKESDKLILVIGSANSARTPRNPLTVSERIDIILAALPIEYHTRIIFTSVEDYTYNLQRWIGAVQGVVFSAIHATYTAEPTKISLIGHNKDHTSFYLNLFPTWESIDVAQKHVLSATKLRNGIYDYLNAEETLDGKASPADAFDNTLFNGWITGYRHKDAIIKYANIWKKMAKEHRMLTDYNKQWGNGPFITVDAVVVQSGHILMIERKSGMGAGTWALPGGFINPHETLANATIRELKEETKLKVPVPVLEGSIVKSKIYDDPHRDERARIITQATLFELREGELPPVKGSDDAKTARWFAINQIMKNKPLIYADHYDIITDILGV
jgi:bifunctional NMN adenylyltransferase/nudix hydrolase